VLKTQFSTRAPGFQAQQNQVLSIAHMVTCTYVLPAAVDYTMKNQLPLVYSARKLVFIKVYMEIDITIHPCEILSFFPKVEKFPKRMNINEK
jgi:hypothetical protein